MKTPFFRAFRRALWGLVLLAIGNTSHAQSRNASGFYLGIGPAAAYYQDVEYATYISRHSGISLSMGFRNENANAISKGGLDLRALIGGAFPQQALQVTLNPNIHYTWMKRVSSLADGSLFLGGRWDVLDINAFVNTELGNNAGQYLSASNLFLTGAWQKQLNRKWDLNTQLSVGLFGFVKESTGFTFSAPQELLEKGDFHYLTADKYFSPLNFKYYKPETIGKYNIFRTEISLTSNNRHRFTYRWNFVNYTQIENYPLNYGQHNVIWTVLF